jgi:hypothetical protein
MKTIRVFAMMGSFAEDKDAAAKLRKEIILPALDGGETIELDFTDVTLTTQSFIHALISEGLRRHGEKSLSRMQFKGCETAVRGIVETVVQYVLEAAAVSSRGHR